MKAWPRSWIAVDGLATLFGVSPLRRLHCPIDRIVRYPPLFPSLQPALLLIAFEGHMSWLMRV